MRFLGIVFSFFLIDFLLLFSLCLLSCHGIRLALKRPGNSKQIVKIAYKICFPPHFFFNFG